MFLCLFVDVPAAHFDRLPSHSVRHLGVHLSRMGAREAVARIFRTMLHVHGVLGLRNGTCWHMCAVLVGVAIDVISGDFVASTLARQGQKNDVLRRSFELKFLHHSIL